MSGLLTPARVDQSARMPGGLLSKALPAPAGWERGGLLIPFNGCSAPVVRDKCEPDEDDLAYGGAGVEFPAVPIEQGAICSTSGPDSQQDQAYARWSATAEYALGQALQTGAGNAPDSIPKLDDVVSMGTVSNADFVAAVSCLEQAAAEAIKGARIMLHAPVRAAAYLAANDLIDVNGNSPSGAPWIISSGYASHPTTPATLIRLYATGTVWASLSEPWAVDGTAYRTNDQWAQARGLGVAAFDPCTLVGIDVTVSACP